MKSVCWWIAIGLSVLGAKELSAQAESNLITIGSVDSVFSNVLNEKRKIWVSVPKEPTTSGFAKQSYPVVYLLDGDSYFYTVMGMIHQLSRVNGNTICPEMIVIGILNTDRWRDLTPSHAVVWPTGDSIPNNNSGGGEQFISFLEKELIPHVDSLYPTAPYRIFVGHSLGGLMVIYTMINHTSLFDSYLAIEPSLLWDHQQVFRQASSDLLEKKFKNKSFFLGVANAIRLMQLGTDTTQVGKDTSVTTLNVRLMLQFAEVLKNNPENGLRSSWKYYKDDDHASVFLIAAYDALHFFFNEYRIPPIFYTYDSAFKAGPAMLTHFNKYSKIMNYEVLPPERIINSYAFVYLRKKLFVNAYAFFEMNVTNYPTSLNVLDSMGDYYAAKGDRQKAIEYYIRAYALNKWDKTKKKLDKLNSIK